MLRWSQQVHAHGVVWKNERSTGASATLAYDGERLYVNFPNSEAVFTTALALDGKILRQRRVSDYRVHQGYGASPVVYQDLLFVVADHRGSGRLAALRRTDGELAWDRGRNVECPLGG